MTRKNYLAFLCCLAFALGTPLAAQTPQDVKTDGPIRFTFQDQELTTGQHVQCRRTFCVTNIGTAPLPIQYVAFQLPNGMVAESPSGTWNAPPAPSVPFSVRNPSFSPFYSIKFEAPTNYSMAPGETRCFTFAIPGITGCPWYTRVTVRVKPKTFYSVLMQRKKTLGGDDDTVVAFAEETETTDRGGSIAAASLNLFPNPAATGTSVDVSQWSGQDVRIRLFDLQGRLVKEWSLVANDAPEYLDLSEVPNGLHLLQVTPDNQPSTVEKIVVQH